MPQPPPDAASGDWSIGDFVPNFAPDWLSTGWDWWWSLAWWQMALAAYGLVLAAGAVLYAVGLIIPAYGDYLRRELPNDTATSGEWDDYRG